jgi:hypothetical protein
MAEVSSTGVAESYELVTADACPSGLPVNLIRDEYTIGRFVELSIAQGGGGNPVPPRAVTAVIPRDVVAPGLLDTYARLNPSATLTDMKGGASLVDEWNEPIEASAPPEEPPLARPVFVSDVNQLIATRVIDLDGEQATVQLDRAAIAALLSTGAAVVPVETGKRRELISIVTKPPAMASKNDGKDAEVSDLSGFLEQPLVSKPDGSLEVADLTAENVEELRQGETTQVSTSSSSDILSVITSAHRIGTRPTAVADDAPQLTVYQGPEPSDLERFHSALAQSLPAFALALYLPFQQRWDLLGYSRGALLNSVSLAPQEDTTIEIFSWDRRKRSVERSTAIELEVESDVSTTTKDSDEVIKEVTRDSSFHAQAGGQLSVAAIGLTIGGGIDSKSAVKDVAKATHNHIEDTVEKTAAKVKASRQTKISETIESGREERITRKVRNPNLCHALTLDYFEVLANYVVRTRFDVPAARLCVLIENPVDFSVDRKLLRVHEDTLRPALFAPSLAEGFEAARLLEARDRACAVACHQCECAPRRPSADQGAEATAAWEAVRQALLQFARQPVSLLADAMPDRYYQAVDAGDRASFARTIADFHRWLYLQALSQAGADAFVRKFIGVVGAVAIGAAAQLNEKWFAEDFWWHVQSLSDAVLNTAELHAAQKDELWRVPVRLSLSARGYEPDMSGVASMAKWATYYRLEDSGLPSAVARFKAAYKAYEAALASAGKSGEQLAAAALALDKEATSAIADTYPLEQVTRAQEREDALIEHIKANKPYYRFVMWRSLDARTQRLRLSPGGSAFGRLVAPEAVGHYGDRLALPVALSAHEQLKKWFSDNLAANTEVTGITGERRVTLPTPGVAMETRLSHCDACEDYIRDQREIDLRTRAAQAAKEEREAERYGQRLKQQPPLLEDPDRPDGSVRVELTQAPPQQA